MPGPVRSLILLALLFAALLAAPATVRATLPPGLFGSIELRGASAGSWYDFGPRMAESLAVFGRCAAAPERCPRADVARLMAEIAPLDSRDPLYQLFAVNRLANRRTYRNDSANFGRRNHWASPLEFLSRSGDCEDYAIFKYALLRHLGLPAEALRVVLLRQSRGRPAHAVLAVYLAGEVFILDNLSELVLPHGRLPDYQALYSFNETRRWAHISIPPDTAAGR